MTWHNKVVWTEGMFLRQQHFQQQDRYLEGLLDHRFRVVSPYGWGFSRLTLDDAALALGKISLQAARGANGASASSELRTSFS